jgi:hypothetical protein
MLRYPGERVNICTFDEAALSRIQVGYMKKPMVVRAINRRYMFPIRR